MHSVKLVHSGATHLYGESKEARTRAQNSESAAHNSTEDIQGREAGHREPGQR